MENEEIENKNFIELKGTLVGSPEFFDFVREVAKFHIRVRKIVLNELGENYEVEMVLTVRCHDQNAKLIQEKGKPGVNLRCTGYLFKYEVVNGIPSRREGRTRIVLDHVEIV